MLLAAGGAFALLRPELHKAVALVFQHGEGQRSLAVILNRRDTTGRGPGFGGLGGTHWRVVLTDPSSDAPVSAANGKSVLRGIHAVAGDEMLSLEDRVVADVLGELAWGPGELQDEVDSGMWLPAAADSVALVDAVSTVACAEEVTSDHGSGCWARLVHRLAASQGSTGPSQFSSAATSLIAVGDELLQEWSSRRWEGAATRGVVRPTLFPGPAAAPVAAGSLLLLGAEALLLVLAADMEGLVAVCLNRPVPTGPGSRQPGPGPAGRRRAAATASPLLRPGMGAASLRRREEDDRTVHFGGANDWDRWTCLVATGTSPPHSVCGLELPAEQLGNSGLWRCLSAPDAWHALRVDSGSLPGQCPASLFARGVVRLGRLELELLQCRGEVGVLSDFSLELRDVVAACAAYRGPQGSGVRLGLYGDHHGFGLWERAVSHAFHGGDDAAATSTRGAIGDRALREWAAGRFSPARDLGKPCL